MPAIKHAANFVSAVRCLRFSVETAPGEPNPALTELQAITAQIRAGAEAYRSRHHEDAVTCFKTAQSMIYRAIDPAHSIERHVDDHSMVLPVGADLERRLIEAGLKFAEQVQPVTGAARPPVRVFGAKIDPAIARFNALGFGSGASVPRAVYDSLQQGVDLLARGHVTQAIESLGDAATRLGTPDTAEARAVAASISLNMGSASVLNGDATKAKSLADEALAEFTALNDEVGRSQAVHLQAVSLQRNGQVDAARLAFESASKLYLAVGEKWYPQFNATAAAPATASGTTSAPLSAGSHVLGTAAIGSATLSPVTRPFSATTLASSSVIREVKFQPSTSRLAIALAAPSVRPSMQLAEQHFILDRDAGAVPLRSAGRDSGWSAVATLNPVEAERRSQTWTLGIVVNGSVVALEWTNGQRPDVQTVIDRVYAPRRDAEQVQDLASPITQPGETSMQLAHLYSLVIPQWLGDCYHAMGDFPRAEQYYLQAAEYTFLHPRFEATALWVRVAGNALDWADRLFREEQVAECRPIYAKLVLGDGAVPTAAPLYALPAFAIPAAEATSFIQRLADPVHPEVNPAIGAPIANAWQRWQYLNAELDFFGLTTTPIFTFDYLQQVARAYAQQAIQAEREYVNFQTQAEAETAARRELEGAVSLAGAEVQSRQEQFASAVEESHAAASALALATLRVEDAQKDRTEYVDAGYWQYVSQSIAAAHGAHEDWHEDEIRRLARDMEQGSWEGNYGKLAAAATLLGGQKSFEYQLGRLQRQVAEMQATIPIAQQQAEAARHRENAALISVQAARLREALTRDALNAFENEVFTPEVWSRMASVMRDISRSYQDFAIRTARLMERAYNFETDGKVHLVKSEYPASFTGGLLGSDALLQDVESFTYHQIAHTRSKVSTLKDVISLANEFPFQFYSFQESGRMNFETELRAFDQRHPGFHSQRIAAVELEIIGLLPPQGACGTLRGGSVSRYRTARGDETLRLHTLDTLALSDFTVRNDAFVYRVDPRIHGLFEGHGVATSWEIDLPRRSNNLDYRLISDVRLVLYYTASFSPELRDAVLSAPPAPGEMIHVRNFLLRYDFPEAWYTFLDSGAMQLEITPDYLPRNEANFRTNRIAVRLITAEGVSAEGVRITITAPGAAPATLVTDGRGEAGALDGNAWQEVMGGALTGSWALRVEPDPGSPLLDGEGKLRGELLEQIALIAQYDFDWP